MSEIYNMARPYLMGVCCIAGIWLLASTVLGFLRAGRIERSPDEE